MSENVVLRRFLIAWLPVAAFCALVFAQSCFPSPNLGLSFPMKDKVQHAGVYGVLAMLFFRACWLAWPNRRSPNQILMLTVLFVMLYGGLDELHQAFVPTRTASWLDVLADGIGGGIGALAGRIFYLRFAGKQKKEIGKPCDTV